MTYLDVKLREENTTKQQHNDIAVHRDGVVAHLKGERVKPPPTFTAAVHSLPQFPASAILRLSACVPCWFPHSAAKFRAEAMWRDGLWQRMEMAQTLMYKPGVKQR
jgi:hypothetical protein